jgi:hypothetical protein
MSALIMALGRSVSLGGHAYGAEGHRSKAGTRSCVVILGVHFREIDLSAFRNSRKEGTDMENKKPHRGRPSRAEASAKALAALAANGIDPASIDPRAVLAAVAADPSAPASARVAAARALLADAQARDS